MFDDLYGEGALEEFKHACAGFPQIREAEIDNGVRLYVHWQGGSDMKIDCTSENVHFLWLNSTRERLYTDLCDSLPELFKAWGVETFTAHPSNEAVEKVLRKRGNWNDEMIWVL